MHYQEQGIDTHQYKFDDNFSHNNKQNDGINFDITESKCKNFVKDNKNNISSKSKNIPKRENENIVINASKFRSKSEDNRVNITPIQKQNNYLPNKIFENKAEISRNNLKEKLTQNYDVTFSPKENKMNTLYQSTKKLRESAKN